MKARRTGTLLFLTVILSAALAFAEPDAAGQGPNDRYFDEQWGVSAIHMAAAWKAGLDGTGVRVAVVDTGISPNHEDLNYDHILEGRNFSGSGDVLDVTDENGHGTFVAGVLAATVNNGLGIAGLVDHVSILPLKCMVTETGARVSAVADAIDYSVGAGCDIIILSIGMMEYSRALEASVDRAANSGAIIFSAVGNVGTSIPYYPAAYDDVIGVGSIGPDMRASSLSQRNESVFVVAPGQDVLGLWINAGKISHRHGSSGLYAVRTGTSYAAPYAAALGVAAKSLFPDITSAEVKRLLMETSMDLGTEGYDSTYGFGLVNAEAFMGRLLKWHQTN